MEMERALKPGRFVRYDDMFDFVAGLERVHEKLAALVGGLETERAVRLYELFLSGCYEKIEQCDDSSAYLSMFFDELFCGWVKARQAAGCDASETVQQILKWKEHDAYGFCHAIEKDMAKVLNREGYRLLVAHFQDRIESAMKESIGTPNQAIFESGNEIRRPGLSLKAIYQARGDSKSYAALCERIGFSPRDSERLAEMEMSKGHWERALGWVEKGLALEPLRDWRNERSPSLTHLKPKILGKLGRTEDALEMAWADFEDYPCDIAYENFMQYVPRSAKGRWHERAMNVATESADLGQFMGLCVKTKEWRSLADRVHAAKQEELEAVSHYSSEPAATALSKRDVLAAAKLYQALGTRIVRSGKSKYYGAALQHLGEARRLYLKAGRGSEWEALVRQVRAEHSRKLGFLSGLESLSTGAVEEQGSFAQRARRRWTKQTA